MKKLSYSWKLVTTIIPEGTELMCDYAVESDQYPLGSALVRFPGTGIYKLVNAGYAHSCNQAEAKVFAEAYAKEYPRYISETKNSDRPVHLYEYEDLHSGRTIHIMPCNAVPDNWAGWDNPLSMPQECLYVCDYDGNEKVEIVIFGYTEKDIEGLSEHELREFITDIYANDPSAIATNDSCIETVRFADNSNPRDYAWNTPEV